MANYSTNAFRQFYHTTATLLVVLLLSVTSDSVSAQKIWVGGAGNGNWSEGANWSDGLPTSDADPWDTFIFGGTLQLNSNNNNGGSFGGFNTNNITFDATAGAFTLTDNGDGFDMLGASSSGAVDGSAFITNNSTNTQTINVNLIHRSDFNTDLTFNATNGDIVVNGCSFGLGWYDTACCH